MAYVQGANGNFTLRAYRGDAKTLLAFNLAGKSAAKNLAGFTIQVQPGGQPAYYLFNELQYQDPSKHAQDPKEPARSSINAPIHKFRWLHVPGSVHQGTQPFFGPYAYTVTPRYFDGKGSMQPLDPKLGASVTVQVAGYQKQGVTLGFTRGYTQSQAFVHHFGLQALIQPKKHDLVYDTAQKSGVNAAGQAYTFADEYQWLGFTARQNLFEVLQQVLADPGLRLDLFAYDLNEPDFCADLLKLARQKRLRVILDNASLHHNKALSTPEDQFEKQFKAAAGADYIKRGKFGRYAHDKVLIVRAAGAGSTQGGPQWGTAKRVLTGSTNFSVTGLYVNSNHILVFEDPVVAADYAGVFDEAWSTGVALGPFAKSAWAAKPYTFTSSQTPKTVITYSPHEHPYAVQLMKDVAARIQAEGKRPKGQGSVLFAVMQIDGPQKKQGSSSSAVSPSSNAVYTALNNLHQNPNIFSYGISDAPEGVYLYPVGKTTGVLVTGKPSSTRLPPPFNQVPNIGGFGHQVHHKFVVCGFNGPEPVVYCGSSNLAEGGESNNGDNLLAIYDGDIATVFAIEALSLVDHFNFLDSMATGSSRKTQLKKAPHFSKSQAALDAGWYLSTDDGWAQKFFDPKDLHCVDRVLFGG